MMISWLGSIAPIRSSSTVWEFGGPLSKWESGWAWLVLAAIALLGAAWIVTSYRWALVTLGRGARGVLIALRIALWLCLLLVLSGPARVERKTVKNPVRPLAVLVDRSGSMLKPDHRGRRRVEDALRRWHAIESTLPLQKRKTVAYAFGGNVRTIDSPDDAPSDVRSGQTELFASLKQVLKEAPSQGWSGVLTLTDGLDTGNAEANGAIADVVTAAHAAECPLYFICGKNLGANEAPFIAVDTFEVPEEVPPHSAFTVVLTLDSFQNVSRTIPMRMRAGDVWHNAGALFLQSGRHSALWQFPVTAETPGAVPLELEVGVGPEQVVLQTQVTVIDPTRLTRILYYEGALDWARSFLANVFRRDTAFEMTSITHVTRSRVSGKDLPDTAAALHAFDVIVIANAAVGQFSEAQQKALSEWVAQGGSLIFLVPDDVTAADYAGSEMERLLPVVFLPKKPAVDPDPEITAYRRRMAALGHSDANAESAFADYAIRSAANPKLETFAWEPRAHDIFNADGEMPSPLFSGYARVLRAKPGAWVLARHPSELAPSGNEHGILLAVQRYGRGQTAALTCDVLWRWKLHEPSGRREVEEFWQQLFAWLGRQRSREGGFYFEDLPTRAGLGSPMAIRVAGEDARTVRVTAALGHSERVELSREVTPSGSTFSWLPTRSGVWSIEARDAKGAAVRHWIAVPPPVATDTGELSARAPNDELLEELSAKTGGSILLSSAPAEWLRPSSDGVASVAEKRTKLWDTGIFLGVMLGLYVLDLILRRRFRLL